MLAILNSLNAHNFPIFQRILMILVSKLMVYRALSNKTYLLLGLLFPLRVRLVPLNILKRSSISLNGFCRSFFKFIFHVCLLNVVFTYRY